MALALLAGIPLALMLAGLTWYGSRQSRIHAAMRDVEEVMPGGQPRSR